MRRCVLLLLALMATPALLGCGDGGPIPIRGTVTLDGKPLPRGQIDFQPADGKGPLAAAEIRDGKYEGAVVPGAKVVSITGGAVIGQHPFTAHPASPMVEDIKPLVPARYNTQTTLRRDITRGEAVYDFELTSR